MSFCIVSWPWSLNNVNIPQLETEERKVFFSLPSPFELVPRSKEAAIRAPVTKYVRLLRSRLSAAFNGHLNVPSLV